MDYKQTLEWLTARIGKKVYRNKVSCPCKSCTFTEENGLIITDAMHVGYICDMIGLSLTEGPKPLQYFDTKEEALEFENTL